MNLKKYIPGHFLCLCIFSMSAQSHVIDSLKHVLQTPKEDTNKVNTLNLLSEKLWRTGKYDTSVICANSAQTLAAKIGFEKGIATAYTNIGIVNDELGKYPKATEYDSMSLAINMKIGNKAGAARNLGSLGIVYDDQGNFTKSLEYYAKALAIYEECKDEKDIAKMQSNIGLVFWEQGNLAKALDYFFKSLATCKKINYKEAEAHNLGNIGLVYQQQKDYIKALDYTLQQLPISEEIGDKHGEENTLGNIGLIYSDEKNYRKSLEYEVMALDLSRKIKDERGEARMLGNIGNTYNSLAKPDSALQYSFQALAINRKMGGKRSICFNWSYIAYAYLNQKNFQKSKLYLDSDMIASRELGLKELLRDIYHSFSRIDSATGDVKAGWESYKNYIAYRDSLINEESIKKTTQAEMNYGYARKTDSAQAVQDKLNAIAEKETQRQKVIRNSFIGGFSIMFLAAVLFFFQRRRIAQEKKRSDELLLNILPEEVAEELKEKGSTEAKTFDEVTVMFTDFKGFTTIAENLSAKELVAEIDYCFKGFDNIIHKYNIEKIKTIGDSYMAAGGLPIANKTHAKDMVNAALEIVDFMEKHKKQRIKEGKPVFEIRIGINTGHVVAGIVGVKKFAYDIWGDTVNLASRMESSGEPGKINISGSTYKLVKNDFTCTHRGKIQAKNKGEVDMYFVEGKS